jgi:SAM-dependent methyltransferase
VLLLNGRYPMRQLMVALLMFAAVTRLPSGVARGDAERSYFGVYRVMLSLDGAYNILIHGTTLHGAQRVRDERGNVVADATPATYYHPASPMAETTKKRRDILASQSRKGRYGVIGLGTGSLACHAAEGEAWRFFEIDPVVVGIAKDSGSFTFIENCQPNPDIVIGDARLTMAKEKDESFDLIIVDAFSSDAVPVHLMTAEALRLYLAKLKPDGIALLHISNRYLDLDAVLAATQPLVAGSHGVVLSDDASDGSYAQSTSTVALFAKSKEALEPYRSIATAIELEAGDVRPWTDDTSDILRPFLSKYRKRF